MKIEDINAEYKSRNILNIIIIFMILIAIYISAIRSLEQKEIYKVKYISEFIFPNKKNINKVMINKKEIKEKIKLDPSKEYKVEIYFKKKNVFKSIIKIIGEKYE